MLVILVAAAVAGDAALEGRRALPQGEALFPGGVPGTIRPVPADIADSTLCQGEVGITPAGTLDVVVIDADCPAALAQLVRDSAPTWQGPPTHTPTRAALYFGVDGDGDFFAEGSPVATVKKRVEPAYPEAAKTKSLGNVVCKVHLTLDKQGAPTKVDVTGCPEEFAPSTRDAVLQWRFQPLLVQEIPVTGYFSSSIRYTPAVGAPGTQDAKTLAERPWLDTKAHPLFPAGTAVTRTGPLPKGTLCDGQVGVTPEGAVDLLVVSSGCPAELEQLIRESAPTWRVGHGDVPTRAGFFFGINDQDAFFAEAYPDVPIVKRVPVRDPVKDRTTPVSCEVEARVSPVGLASSVETPTCPEDLKALVRTTVMKWRWEKTTVQGMQAWIPVRLTVTLGGPE